MVLKMKIKALSQDLFPYYLEAIAELRVKVWNQQINQTALTERTWSDNHDSHAFHWIVLNEQNQLIASARLCIHNAVSELPDLEEIEKLVQKAPVPVAMMSRLVVDPLYQRRGIARKLDSLRLEKAKQQKAKSVVLQVPDYRRKAVEELGFDCLGRAEEKTFQGDCDVSFYAYIKRLHSIRRPVQTISSCMGC